MRVGRGAAVLIVALMAIAGCGNDPEPAPGSATPTDAAAQTISTEDFCGRHGSEVLEPLSDDFAAAAQIFATQLSDLKPTDTEEIEALIDGIDTATAALVAALYDTAERLEDPTVAADVTDAAEAFSTFPDALRDAFATGGFGEDPSVAIDEAFGALDRHC